MYITPGRSGEATASPLLYSSDAQAIRSLDVLEPLALDRTREAGLKLTFAVDLPDDLQKSALQVGQKVKLLILLFNLCKLWICVQNSCTSLHVFLN